MDIFEAKQKIEFLNEELRHYKNITVALEKELNAKHKRYEYEINELEARLKWLKDRNSDLIKLALEVIHLHNDEESGEE